MLLHSKRKQRRGNRRKPVALPEHCCISERKSEWLERKKKCWERSVSWFCLLCVGGVYKVYWQSLKPISYEEWRQDYSCHHLLFWGTERKSKEIIPSAYILAIHVLLLLLELYISPDLILYSIYNVNEFIETCMKHVWISADPPVPDEWYNLHSPLSDNVLLLA